MPTKLIIVSFMVHTKKTIWQLQLQLQLQLIINSRFRKTIYSSLTVDQELASIQSKAIGLKKASGIPKELTKESA